LYKQLLKSFIEYCDQWLEVRHLSTTAKINHPWEYIHDHVGYNYRMPNLNAALGLAQVENIKKFLQSKRKLFTEYNKKFSNVDSIKILKESKNSKSNYWLNSIILKKPSIKNRDKIIKLAKENNIYLRPVWRPLHMLRPYKSMPRMSIKNANVIYKSLMNIPSSTFYFLNKKLLK
jgi:dTDP-4-amino-4,6-dideoxygalactose transaminase